jgi:hypothetical protein
VEPDLSRVWLDQAGEARDKSRLAGAVVTHQGNDLGRPERQIDARQRRYMPVALDEAYRLESTAALSARSRRVARRRIRHAACHAWPTVAWAARLVNSTRLV